MLRLTEGRDAAVAFRDRVAGFVAARVPEPDVDDVVQEVYLRLAKATGEVEHLSGFMHQVARSAVADYHRRRAREPALAPLEPATEQEDGGDAERVVASWLGPLVEELEEPFREALRLTELEGLSHAEVAARLGVPRSTVSSRVQRGRALLREALTRCCVIELDVRGRVVDWEPRGDEVCCD